MTLKVSTATVTVHTVARFP